MSQKLLENNYLHTTKVSKAMQARESITLFFRSIEKNFNPIYIDSFISNITIDRKTINVSLNQIRDVPVDFWMKVAILYKQQSSKTYRSMVSFNINVCDMLRSELNHQSLVHLWFANLLKYSNMPRTCPWKAGSYHWHNLRPEPDSIPKFISTGLYRVDAKFYLKASKNDLYTNMTIIFETHRK
ncbi:uncharacterized protein LOC105210603 [Zeugodacus cucurbitae]|uniref:uncharacterized protein LOC105210603 n=1 Tax=Zeugodacus cucurbitae TaxID=28588 RepID=UPI0023D96771|nr:uncharacterized protein LOC105210603 [Zeugodacus cucurbitae]